MTRLAHNYPTREAGHRQTDGAARFAQLPPEPAAIPSLQRTKKFREVVFAFLRVTSWIVFLAACAAPASAPKSLTVFAASSTLDAFNEIGEAFESANPGVTVAFNFDGSQSLRTQLEQGAEADIFASANQSEMDALATQSLISNSQIFLINQLVVILPSGNPAGVQTLNDLARPGLTLVLAAEDVPVGQYSREALSKLEATFGAGFKDQVLANLVSEENNVKQVVAKIQLGEADAGIVYNSDAVATPDLQTLSIPAEFNVTALYPIAVMKNAPNRELAEAFLAYVLSSDGQTTLKKWGFTPVTP